MKLKLAKLKDKLTRGRELSDVGLLGSSVASTWLV